MKHSLVILAFLICLRPLFPTLEYAANYDYIVNVLCENREQPELQCYGKCYLMNAIVREVRSNDQKSPELPQKTELPLLYTERNETISLLYHPFPGKKSVTCLYLNSYSFLHIHKLLKPPITLS